MIFQPVVVYKSEQAGELTIEESGVFNTGDNITVQQADYVILEHTDTRSITPIFNLLKPGEQIEGTSGDIQYTISFSQDGKTINSSDSSFQSVRFSYATIKMTL